MNHNSNVGYAGLVKYVWQGGRRANSRSHLRTCVWAARGPREGSHGRLRLSFVVVQRVMHMLRRFVEVCCAPLVPRPCFCPGPCSVKVGGNSR